MWQLRFALLLSLLTFVVGLSDARAVPSGLTLQGRLLNNGTAVEGASVDVIVRVTSVGVSECTLYEETQNLNMTNSDGLMNVTVGSGTRTASDKGFTIARVFSNKPVSYGSLTCTNGGTSYTPANADSRNIYVSFNDGGTTVAFASPFIIQSVPYALEANTLAGLAASDFIQTATDTTQTKVNTLMVPTTYNELIALAGGTSTQYATPGAASFTANVNFNSHKITGLANPTAATDGANKQYVDGYVGGKAADTTTLTGLAASDSGKVLSWNGTQWTAAAAADATKLPLAGGTMSGAIAMGSNNITGAGYITQNAGKYIQFGNLDDTAEAALVATPLTSAYAGATWYNTTSGQMKYWNGSAVKAVGINAFAAQSANSVFAGPSSGGSSAPAFRALAEADIPQLTAASKVTNSATTAVSTSTASAIVARDSSGDFAAHNITMNRSIVSTGAVFNDGQATPNTAMLQAPSAISTSYVLKLPTALAGSSGQVLSSDTSGQMSWASLATSLPPSGSAGGDLSGTYPGPTVATVGSVTAANVASGANAANAAVATSTASKIIVRDGSANFAANVATLNGVNLNNAGSVVSLVNPVGAAYTLTVPVTSGSAGQVLSTDGSGLTSWISAVSSATGFINGGNSFSGLASLGTNDNSDLALKTNGTTKMTLQAAGNVGIGTTMPVGKLHIAAAPIATANYPLFALGSGAFDGSSAGYYAGSSSGTVIGSNTASGYAGDLINMQIAGVSKFKVDASGNITSAGTTTSTGTTTTSGNFSQTGTATFSTGTGTVSLNGATSVSSSLSVTGATTLAGGTSITNSTASTSTGTGALVVSGGIGAAGNVYSGGVVATANGTPALPAHTFTADTSSGMYSPGSTNLALSTNGNERIRVESNGNVGIGTTNPGNRLTVALGSNEIAQLNDGSSASAIWGQNIGLISTASEAAISARSTTPIVLYTGGTLNSLTKGTPRMTVTSAGNVGIGTTNPSSSLSFSGDNSRSVGVERQSVSNTSGRALTLFSGGAATGASDKAGGDLLLSSGIATGTGSSKIQFVTYPASSSGSSDNIATTAMTIASSGNVGIGTPSPAQRLDVQSSSAPQMIFTDTTNSRSASFGVNDGFNAVIDAGGGSIIMKRAGTSWITVGLGGTSTVFQTGNVGIGTTAPAARLQVSAAPTATANYPLFALGTGAFDGTTSGYFAGSSSGTVIGANLASGYAGDLVNLQIAGVSKFNVDASGNISSSGTTTTTGATTTSGNFSQTGSATFSTGTGNVSLNGVTSITNSTASTSTSTGALVVSGGIGAAGNVYSGGVVATANGTAALPSHTFTTDNSSGMWSPGSTNLALSTNGTERLRIDAAGKVGIGTTTLSGRLNVFDTTGGFFFDGSAASYNRFKSTGATAVVGRDLMFSAQNSGSTPDLYVANSGNVGIGTTSPAYALDVNGTVSASIILTPALRLSSGATSFYSSSTPGEYIYGSSGSGASYPFTSTGNLIIQSRTNLDRDIDFVTGGTTPSIKMMIDSSTGNVGIGTTAPTAKLTLAGGSTAAKSASLKFLAASSVMTTPEDGAMEYDATSLYYTIGSTRYVIPMNTAAGNYSNVSSIGNTSGSITMTPMSGNSVIVNSATVSTSAVTGALVVSGGVGISGAVNTTGNINSGGAVTATTNMITPQLYGSTAASGAIRIDGTSNATPGNVYLASAGGYVGIGTTAPAAALDVRPTNTVTTDNYGSNVFLTYSPTADSTGTAYGQLTRVTTSTANNLASLVGQSTQAIVGSAATGTTSVAQASVNTVYNQSASTVTNAYGTNSSVVNSGSGLITGARAITAGISNTGSGTITNSYGVVVSGPANTGTGSITNFYGVYISTPSAATTGNYAIYSQGGANYFGGSIGIGTASPRAPLDVAGTVLMKAATSNATTTIDYSLGNIQYTTASCQAFQLNNLKDGGSYTFVVKGATSATCSFTAFSDAGSTALTVHMPPDHDATTASKHALYSLLVAGADVYISWISPY